MLGFACASTKSSSEVEVHVVDKSSGDPAAGARVDYLDVREIDGRKLFANLLAQFDDETANRFCAHALTDAHGRARIPLSDGLTGISVRLGNKSAVSEIDPDSTKVLRVALEPNKRISVLNEHGKPVADAPLLLYFPGPPPFRDGVTIDRASEPAETDESGIEIAGQPFWVGHSNAEGNADIANWRERVHDAGTQASIRLCLLGEFAVGDRRSFAKSLPGVDVRRDDGPVAFTIPSSGSVTVNVRRADGKPSSGELLVELFTYPRDYVMNDDDTPLVGAWSDFHWVDGGSATFGSVLLERRLSVSARAFDGSRRASKLVDGPRTVGETVVVDLDLGERLPTLIGRLLDDHGEPIRLSSFEASWSGSDEEFGFDETNQMITDGGGRFRLDLIAIPATGESGERELEISLDGSGDDFLVGRVRTTHSLDPGDIDLGDITLKRETKSK